MKSRWKRVALWSALGLVVLLLIAGGSFYLWFRGQVSASNNRVEPGIIEALRETTTSGPPVTSAAVSSTTSTSDPTPQTPSGMNFVLVGCDKRAQGSKEITEGRSDTIILVHVDPEKDFLSLLSVPRDLLADVPGYGLYKINAAYAFGGGALLIRTLQANLKVDLDHYIGLDLEAFKAITNALGGVYIDVDRRYLNTTLSWEHIDLQPGYQLLNGVDALDYVRFRHDSNIDFGRMARQQQFLTAIREQALGWDLTFKLPSLIKAFFNNVDTDLSTNDLIRLAYWATKLDGSRMKRAEIKAKTGTIHGAFYVLPTEKQLAAAVEDFLTPPTPGQVTAGSSSATTAPPSAAAPILAQLQTVDLSRTNVDVLNATGRVGQGAFAAVWLSTQGASVPDVREASEPLAEQGVVRFPAGRKTTAEDVARALGIERTEQASGISRVTAVLGSTYRLDASQVARLSGRGAESSGQVAGGARSVSLPDSRRWNALAEEAGFPLVAPSYVPPSLDYSFSRSYGVKVGGRTQPVAKVGYVFNGEDLCVGVSQTRWLDASLAAPGVSVQGDGIVYTIVASGTKAERVWWKKDGVLHWVSNTLFADLSREQLLAMAVSAVPVAEDEG